MVSVSATDFGIYTAILFMFPVACVVVIAAQLFADRYNKRNRDKHTSILLYGVYISGLFCGVDGFLLHAAESSIWCETIGLIPCFACLGLSKVFLYSFFLRRAKLAQGITIHSGLRTLFKYVAPVYLFFYWMIYCVLSAIVFTGVYSNDRVSISNCMLSGEYGYTFTLFAGFVDVFNSILAMSLFSYPLIRAMHEAKLLGGSSQVDHKTDKRIRTEFISVMKWNVCLTTIASLSSVTNLFMLLVAGHYIWLFCLGDPLINAVCVYLMIAPNREYAAYRFGCKQSSHESDETQSVKKTATGSKQSANSSQLPSGNTPHTLQTAHSDSDTSLPAGALPDIDVTANTNSVTAFKNNDVVVDVLETK